MYIRPIMYFHILLFVNEACAYHVSLLIITGSVVEGHVSLSVWTSLRVAAGGQTLPRDETSRLKKEKIIDLPFSAQK